MNIYSGIVEGGGKRAAGFGYPTANIALSNASASGIYAARIHALGNTYEGVAYADTARGILEAHLFDFSGELYGKEVEVTLEKKLRETMDFPDEKTARDAIAKDAEAARAYFRL